jgi:hypothetical protein
MIYLRKFFLVLLIILPISKAFGANATLKQSVEFGTGGLATELVLNGIEFNPDGTKMFLVSFGKTGSGGSNTTDYVNEYNLSTPFDISTASYAGDSERCHLDDTGTTSVDKLSGAISFNSDGTKILAISRGNLNNSNLMQFNLSVAYDVSTCSFDSSVRTDTDALQDGTSAGDSDNNQKQLLRGAEYNNDGTRIFLSINDNDSSQNDSIKEYHLSTAYDLSTMTLQTTAISLAGTTIQDLTFGDNGKKVLSVNSASGNFYIAQYTLSTAYSLSGAVLDGTFSTSGITNQRISGIKFSTGGFKLFVTEFSGVGDYVYEFDVACPFNIISGKCPSITENSDRTGMAEAQIEVARRTIENSTDNALNRLKWIRRNKDIQNLSHQNIKLNFSNEMLASISEAINISTKPKKKNKDQDIFYWSEGSMGFGKVRKTSVASVKKIKTDGVTVGVDKFTKNNGIKGLAFRFGKNDVSVGYVGSKLDTDTYNLTYYSTSPLKNDTKYLDTVIGIGALKSDILSVLDGQRLTGNRNGKQIYGTIKLKDEIKKDNLTLIPSGQIDLGYTLLSSYSESGKTGMKFDEQSIQSRNIRLAIASVEEINHEKYKMKRHGKLEYKANLHRSSNIKYSYISDSTNAKFDTELTTEALHNINGEIGVDIIFSDNFSIFFIYEHNEALGVGYTNKIHIAIGYLPNKNTNYAFSINGSENLMSQFIVKKNINGYDLTFNLNDDLTNLGNNKEASINLNKVF